MGCYRTLVAVWNVWQLQSRLLDIGAHLATPLSSSSAEQIDRMHFDDDEVKQLERWIDKVKTLTA